MSLNLLDIIAGTGDKSGNYYFNNFGEAALYALIGFVVVFLGITIIILVIWLLGLLMKKTNNFELIINKFKRNKKTESIAEPTNEVAVPEGEIPDEVKAAIVAAIMAYYEEKQEKCRFVVKRIRKI